MPAPEELFAGGKALFITGTDTGIGKTHFCAELATRLLACGRKVAYFKPIQTGCEEKEVNGAWIAPDVQFVRERCPQIIVKCTYAFELPATPELAAEVAGAQIEFSKIKADFEELKQQADFVLVEGAGGLYVPIGKGNTIGNLIEFLTVPCLLVSANRLGTINQTCLSLHYARSLGINVLGFAFSGLQDPQTSPEVAKTNARFIEEYSGVRFLN